MFKSLLRVYREKTVTEFLVTEFLSMVENARKMFVYSHDSLKDVSMQEKASEAIYLADRSINMSERDIRKRILIHIKTVPECNLPAHLVFVSIIKDAERLGDYVKNCYELKSMLKDMDSDREMLLKLYDDFAPDILNLFDNTLKAIQDSDKTIGMKVMEDGRSISKACQDLIEKSVDSDAKTRYVVVTVLAARYFKRISLHLSNIASSVVNPLPEVDYSL